MSERAFLGAVEALTVLPCVWGRLHWQDPDTGRIVSVVLAGAGVAPLPDPERMSAADRDTLVLFQPGEELTRSDVKRALSLAGIDHGGSTVEHSLARHVRLGRLVRIGRKGPYRLP